MSYVIWGCWSTRTHNHVVPCQLVPKALKIWSSILRVWHWKKNMLCLEVRCPIC